MWGKKTAARTYDYDAGACWNCGRKQKVQIPFGTLVKDYKFACADCGARAVLTGVINVKCGHCPFTNAVLVKREEKPVAPEQKDKS